MPSAWSALSCPGAHKARIRVLPVPGFHLEARGTGLLLSWGSREMEKQRSRAAQFSGDPTAVSHAKAWGVTGVGRDRVSRPGAAAVAVSLS